MIDIPLFPGFISNQVAGIQYRHQSNPILAWRATAGHFSFSNEGTTVHLYPYSADTIRTRHTYTNIKGIALSAGFEAQRQFFKKVYFYGGIEARAGYGTAYQDTQLTYQYVERSQIFPLDTGLYTTTRHTSTSGADGNGMFISATFLAGARIYIGRRIIIGTEFSNPAYYFNYHTPERSGNTSGIAFSLDHVTQRCYLSYRFQ